MKLAAIRGSLAWFSLLVVAPLLGGACGSMSNDVAHVDASPDAPHADAPARDSQASHASDATTAPRDAGVDVPDATLPPRDAAIEAAGDAPGHHDAHHHHEAAAPSDAGDAGQEAGGDSGVNDDAAHDSGVDVATDAGPPTLLSLVVSPLTLTPAFSPTIHDYYVRCAAGANALTVSVTAATGSKASLRQPITTSAATEQTVAVSALEDQAIVVSVRPGHGGSASPADEYWVRCLPHDFADLVVEAHPGAGAPTPGYYLVGNMWLTGPESSYAMALDVHGVPVWYGRTVVPAAVGGTKNVQFFATHKDAGAPYGFSYAPDNGFTLGTYSVSWELHTIDPIGVTYVAGVGVPLDTHELTQLPNGDFLVQGVPIKTGVDLTGIDGLGANENIVDCVIQEISPTGALVWQWVGSDHMDPQHEALYVKRETVQTLDGGTLSAVDPFHCNSLDYDDRGDILMSVPNLDAIVLIDKSTGTILWKIGGTVSNRDNAPHVAFVGDDLNGFYRQHDARFLPDGTISVFDDEAGQPAVARGLIFSYDVDAGTASVVWQYRGTSSISAMGSLTVLPDGSRTIGWGSTSHILTETNLAGDDLLDFGFSDHDQSYRAIKVLPSTFDLDTMRHAVGAYSSTQDAGADGG